MNKPDYIVYINLEKTKECMSEKEAWEEIGKHPIFCLYEVRNKKNEIREEFIPF